MARVDMLRPKMVFSMRAYMQAMKALGPGVPFLIIHANTSGGYALLKWASRLGKKDSAVWRRGGRATFMILADARDVLLHDHLAEFW